MMNGEPFNPTEIIFSVTERCNLKCSHCFVSKSTKSLKADDAIKFLESIKKSDENQIDTVGFSGGEPFLALDFILSVVKAAVSMDFMFDQIITNADWWKDESELSQKLTELYNAGYDGKIGISWDIFHNQTPERMKTFMNKAKEIFGEEAVNLQVCVPQNETKGLFHKPLTGIEHLEKHFGNGIKEFLNGTTIYTLPQTFQASDENAWKSKKWFNEDFCLGPGNILFVHPDGNIAPCCGFANENSELFIGTITDSIDKVLENSQKNKMLKLCYEQGLSSIVNAVKTPGKTGDICSFCDFICKNHKEIF